MLPHTPFNTNIIPEKVSSFRDYFVAIFHNLCYKENAQWEMAMPKFNLTDPQAAELQSLTNHRASALAFWRTIMSVPPRGKMWSVEQTGVNKFSATLVNVRCFSRPPIYVEF